MRVELVGAVVLGGSAEDGAQQTGWEAQTSWEAQGKSCAFRSRRLVHKFPCMLSLHVAHSSDQEGP